jgi:excinuclease ABC subunit B
VHKPGLDEMGIATWHEVMPDRGKRAGPRKPTLDEMGPGTESKLYQPKSMTESMPNALPRSPGKHGGASSSPGSGSKIIQPTNSRESGPEFGPAPRSSGGAPGHRGGWKKR